MFSGTFNHSYSGRCFLFLRLRGGIDTWQPSPRSGWRAKGAGALGSPVQNKVGQICQEGATERTRQNLRPGLEKMFNDETAPLSDKTIPRSVRLQQWLRLIRVQEGVVKIQSDGSIATPIDPEEKKDAMEYFERLRHLKVPLS